MGLLIRVGRSEWIPVFTGLSVRQFRALVRIVVSRGGEQVGVGRPWGLLLADRVLLTAVYYRTNLTFRQVGLLFGISKSAAHRVVEHLAPLLVLPPVTTPHHPDTVLIVDGTLVPTYDRGVSASSKNYRYSVNLQVVIDANTRQGVAVGATLPGNRHDSRAYRESGVELVCVGAHVLADGGYQGNPKVILPYRKPRYGPPVAGWQEELNRTHRRVRARIEHALAHMKSWNILRNCRRKGIGVWYAVQAVALMRNLAMTA